MAPLAIHTAASLASFLVGPIYLALTIAALASLISPTLDLLSSHGKTRFDASALSSSSSSPGSIGSKNSRNNKSSLVTSSSSSSSFASSFLTKNNNEKFTISKSRFSDFYVVGIAMTAILLVMLTSTALVASDDAVCTTNDNDNDYDHQACNPHDNDHHNSNIGNNLSLKTSFRPTLLLLLTHLLRRYYECNFIQQSNTSSSKMHVAGYLLGLVHYLCLPFVYYFGGITNTTAIAMDQQYQDGILMKRILLVAIVIGCLYFQYQQYRHHVLLARLRTMSLTSANTTDGNINDTTINNNGNNTTNLTATKTNPTTANTHSPSSNSNHHQHQNHQPTNTTHYKIPKGGWFHHVTCPHYFSEIMIYIMLAFLVEIQNNSNSNNNDSSESSMQYYKLLQQHSFGNTATTTTTTDIIDYVLIAIHKQRHWMVVLWVATNLSISAWKSHEWYLAQFGTMYPSCRRRLVPFLW